MSVSTKPANHNQFIINIETPHIKLPGIQLLRPDEIKFLVDKEKNKNQREEGIYIPLQKYEFIVKESDIEKNDNQDKDKKNIEIQRPKTAPLKFNKKVKEDYKTKQKLKLEEKIESIKEKFKKKKENNNYNLDEENDKKEENQNESINISKISQKDDVNSEDQEEKNIDLIEEENPAASEHFEKIDNEINNEEIEEEEDIGSDISKTEIVIKQKNNQSFQSSMANMLQDLYSELEETENSDTNPKKQKISKKKINCLK